MLSIKVPKTVNIISGLNYVQIEGPLGTIVKDCTELEIIQKESRLYCIADKNLKYSQTYLSLLRSLVFGVAKGYRRKLRLVGVGFKAFVQGAYLMFKIGFSHESKYLIPKDIKITCSKVKGIIIAVSGIERSRVNQVAVEIRRFRMPDIYKGKGIHYNKEAFKLKKGKREGK
jgi:large subunit ribosomal protein L6